MLIPNRREEEENSRTLLSKILSLKTRAMKLVCGKYNLEKLPELKEEEKMLSDKGDAAPDATEDASQINSDHKATISTETNKKRKKKKISDAKQHGLHANEFVKSLDPSLSKQICFRAEQ